MHYFEMNKSTIFRREGIVLPMPPGGEEACGEDYAPYPSTLGAFGPSILAPSALDSTAFWTNRTLHALCTDLHQDEKAAFSEVGSRMGLFCHSLQLVSWIREIYRQSFSNTKCDDAGQPASPDFVFVKTSLCISFVIILSFGFLFCH